MDDPLVSQSLFSRELRCNPGVAMATCIGRGLNPFSAGNFVATGFQVGVPDAVEVSIPFQQGTSLQLPEETTVDAEVESQSLFSRELRCNTWLESGVDDPLVSQSLFSRELRCNSHLSEVRLAGICGPVCENLSEDRPSAT